MKLWEGSALDISRPEIKKAMKEQFQAVALNQRIPLDGYARAAGLYGRLQE